MRDEGLQRGILKLRNWGGKMAEKNYIRGFVRKFDFTGGGSVLNVSINLEDLQELSKDDYGNVKIKICEKRNHDKYGTHYIVEDDFVPRQAEEPKEDMEL